MNIKQWLSTCMWMAFFVVLLQGCGVVSHPMYEGQVLDLETHEPIEGASVVATYHCETTTIIDSSATAVVNVREVVTDGEGMFYLPSHTAVIPPVISWGGDTDFIIFKPGYYPVEHSGIGGCFTQGKCTEQEVWASPPRERPLLLPDYVIEDGSIGLTKIVSERDRRVLLPSPVHLHESKTPHLMKLIKEEYKRFGIKEIGDN